MPLLNRIKSFFDVEVRSSAGVSLNDPKLFDELGFAPRNSSAGLAITPDTSLRLATVYACTNLIAESLASLPAHVYRRTSNGKELAMDHPVYRLINSEPNELMSSFTWKHSSMIHTLLRGNSYALIQRNRAFRPIGLKLLIPGEASVVWDKDRETIYYNVNGRKIQPYDIIHFKGMTFNGLQGLSPISYMRETIGLGMAAEQFGASFFGNGANMSGVLEHPGKMSPEQRSSLRDQWKEGYEGLSNSHKTAILEGGMKYTRISVAPEDAQYIEARKLTAVDVCSIFRVPPHMVGHLDRATNNNIEHQSIEFVKYCLRPWIERVEQELERKLFREDEKGRYFIKFDTNSLMRGDMKSKGEYYTSMLSWGVMTQNEVRALEDLNPKEGLDKHYVPLNMGDANNTTNQTNGTKI